MQEADQLKKRMKYLSRTFMTAKEVVNTKHLAVDEHHPLYTFRLVVCQSFISLGIEAYW